MEKVDRLRVRERVWGGGTRNEKEMRLSDLNESEKNGYSIVGGKNGCWRDGTSFCLVANVTRSIPILYPRRQDFRCDFALLATSFSNSKEALALN